MFDFKLQTNSGNLKICVVGVTCGEAEGKSGHDWGRLLAECNPAGCRFAGHHPTLRTPRGGRADSREFPYFPVM
jgi:hypothetical protein